MRKNAPDVHILLHENDIKVKMMSFSLEFSVRYKLMLNLFHII